MTKKLKLKGRNATRIPAKKKKKMQKTLDKMQKTRKEDSLNMRDVVEGKLKWALEERKRGLFTNEKIRIQIHKLDGIITVLEELLGKNVEGKG